MFGDSSHRFGGSLAALPEVKRVEARGLGQVQRREQVQGEPDAAQHVGSELSGRESDVDRAAAVAEERGVRQLEDEGGHSGIFGDERADLFDRRIVLLQEVGQEFVVIGMAGETIQMGQPLAQFAIGNEVFEVGDSLEGRRELAGLARFAEELVGGTHALHQLRTFRVTREDEAQGARVACHDFVQEVASIDAWHFHVGDHDVEGGVLQERQSGRTAVGERHVPVLAHRPEAALECLQQVRIIVHEQDVQSRVHGGEGLRSG